jgi:hypothetical protein
VQVRTEPYIRWEVKYGRHLAYLNLNLASPSFFFKKSHSYSFFHKNLTKGLVADTKLEKDERPEGWKARPYKAFFLLRLGPLSF